MTLVSQLVTNFLKTSSTVLVKSFGDNESPFLIPFYMVNVVPEFVIYFPLYCFSINMSILMFHFKLTLIILVTLARTYSVISTLILDCILGR